MDRKIKKKTLTPAKFAAIVAGITILGFILYTQLYRDDRSRSDVDREKLIVQQVEEGDFLEFIDVNGTVQPIRTTYLDAIEGGVVRKVYKESGAIVDAGDTLLVLTNSNLQLQVLQQEAGIYDQINNVRNSRLNLEQNHLRLREELANARTRLDLLNPRYERDSLLYQQDLISIQDFEETRQAYRFQKMRYQLNYESYRKDSLQMKNQLTQLDQSEQRMWQSLNGVQQILSSLTVLAPISGQLSTIELNQGQSIRQGERIGQIDRLDGYRLRISIDEFYLSRITAGLKGTFSFAGETHQIEVVKMFPVIQDGQFHVDAEFINGAPEGLRRGQTARIRLELSGASSALLLARGGFFQQTGGNWIYILNEEESRAHRKPIRLGRGNSQYFEILEGLKPGDKVITSSYDTFAENEVLILQ